MGIDPTGSVPIKDNGGSKFLQSAGEFFRQQLILVALVVLVLLFGFSSPFFFSITNLANIGRQTAQVSIIACGMTLVIIAAQIDLSVGSVLSLAGMVAGLTIKATGITLLGVIAGLGLGAAVGLINGLLTTKGKIPAFLTTLATMGIARGLTMMVTQTKDVVIYRELYWKLFGDGELLHIPSQIIWTLIVAIITGFLLRKSVYGRRVYATGGNLEAARFSGINTDKIIISVFIITGTLAALSGIVLSSQMHTSRPHVGVGMELNAIAAVILGGTSLFGGKGSILGTIVGSLIIGVLNNGLLLLGFSSYFQMVIRGVVIILAVLLLTKTGE
jgi:ribose/xylose/arabinose/galactoside ABC-type transport system permease subunit